MKLKVKPLSVNKAWKGKRFKTKEYTNYEKHVALLLKDMEIPDGKLGVYLEFGFSYSGSDWDNPIKPFIDILQKRYGFNDSRIFEATVIKKIVKKGEEYVKFEISKASGKKV